MPKRPAAARLEPPKIADGTPYRTGSRVELVDGTIARPLYCRPATALERETDPAAWRVRLLVDDRPAPYAPRGLTVPPAKIERIHP